MSDLYLYPCSCGHSNRVTVSDAGKTIQCEGCSEGIELPGLREIRRLEVAGEDPKSAKAEKNWTFEKGLWFSIGLGGMLIGLTVAAIFFYIAHFEIVDDRPSLEAVWHSTDEKKPAENELVWGRRANPNVDRPYELTKWDGQEQVWYFADNSAQNPDYFAEWGLATNPGVAFEADIGNKNLQQLWQAWNEIESTPLEEWKDPPYLINSRYSRTFYIFAAVFAGVALLGAGMLVFGLTKK